MHVCTCSNQELLSIEDRLEGVRQLYCENFAGCAKHVPDGPRIELAPLETSGLVYLRAVHRDLAKHHLLAVRPGPAVPTPILPLAGTIAPRPERRLAAPLAGILAIAFLLGAALTLAVPAAPPAAPGGGPPQAQGALALIAGDEPAESSPAPLLSPSPGLCGASAVNPTREVVCRPPATLDSAPAPSVASRPVARVNRVLVAVSPRPPRITLQAPPALAAQPRAPAAPEAKDLHKPVQPVLAAPLPGSHSLERILKHARGKTGTVLPPAEVLPERLGKSALGRVQSQLRRRAGYCLKRFGFTHVTARVQVRVRGDRGRVTWAGVQGRLKGTPAGRCIERAARHLRTPRFERSRQTLTIPFRVR